MATVNLRIVSGEVVSFEYRLYGMGSWTKCTSSVSIPTSSTAVEIRNIEAYPGWSTLYHMYYNLPGETTYTKAQSKTFSSSITIDDVSYNRYIQFGATKSISYSITINKGSYLSGIYGKYYLKSTFSPVSFVITSSSTKTISGFDSSGYVYLDKIEYTTGGSYPVKASDTYLGTNWTVINNNGAWLDHYINIKPSTVATSRVVTLNGSINQKKVKITAGTGVSKVYIRIRAQKTGEWGSWVSSTTSVEQAIVEGVLAIQYKFDVASGYGSNYYLTYNTSDGATKTIVLSGSPSTERNVDDFSYDRYLTLSATKDSKKTYYLKFDKQGGTGGPSDMQYGPTTETSHTFSIPGAPNIPTKQYCKFLGWSNEPNGRVIIQPSGGTYTVTASTTYLYAVWDEGYTVVIQANPSGSGTVDGENESVIDKFYSGTSWKISNKTLSFDKSATGQTLSFTPVANDGYSFSAWDRTGSSGTITSNDSFIANFEGKIYAATIDLNGGKAKEGKSEYCKTRRVKFGDIYSHDYTTGSVQTLELPDSTIVEKANYDFVRLKNTSTEATVTNNTKVTATSNHALQVEWSRIVYTVGFDSKGGTPVSSISLDDSKDPQVILSDACSTTRENYNFIGWKSPKGNMYYVGSTIKYSEEQEAFDATGHTLLLEAQWEPELAIKVTVNENGNIRRKQVSIKDGVYVCTPDNTWKLVTDWWTYTTNGWKHMVDNE